MLTTLMSSVAITVPSASTGNTRQRGRTGSPAPAAGETVSFTRSALTGPAQDLGQCRALAVHEQADAEDPRRGRQREPGGAGQQRDRHADLPQRNRRAL